MEPKITFRELFGSARHTQGYAVEGAIIEFTEQVVARMDALKLNRSRLAEAIKSSPQYVTKMLGGNTNFTLESMVKVANALDSDVRVRLVPKTRPTVWIELAEKAAPSRPSDLVAWANQFHMKQTQPEREQCPPQAFSRNEIPIEMPVHEEVTIAT